MSLFRRDAARSIQVDFLRGAAILLVLCRHQVVVHADRGILAPVSKFMFQIGWVGVDLFFVLSGFLVGGLLFLEIKKRSALGAGRFIIRRGFKIWPAYYVFLLALTFIISYTGKGMPIGNAAGALIPNFLHYQNYLNVPRDHTWSLAVEEHFYILLPLMLYLLTAGGKNWKRIDALPWIALIVCSACAIMRIHSVHTDGLFFRKNLKPTHLHMDALFFGVVLAYYYHFKPQVLAAIKKHKFVFLLIGLALLSPLYFFKLEKDKFITTIGIIMFYYGFGFILLVSMFSSTDSGVSGRFYKSYLAKIVAFIGFHSYSIYLWHIDLGQRFIMSHQKFLIIKELPGWLVWSYMQALFWIAAIVGGVLMAAIVERPFLNLRDRFFPSKLPNQDSKLI